MEFSPNLTPKEVIQSGAFGGTYFNKTKQNLKINPNEFPKKWFKGLSKNQYESEKYNRKVNFFKIKSGLSQKEWEEKGWIHPQDPRGWFQWYCRYYLGRRTDDDSRQISRWNNFCGIKGRWRNYIYSKIYKKNTTIDDLSFSLAVRQSLLHWAYKIKDSDYEIWKIKNGYK